MYAWVAGRVCIQIARTQRLQAAHPSLMHDNNGNYDDNDDNDGNDGNCDNNITTMITMVIMTL